MRLKTYTAPTMPEAMALVRDEMGDDAIIVSTHPPIDGLACRVTAAIEEDLLPVPEQSDTPEPVDTESRVAYLRQVLIAHGIPPHITEALLRSIDDLSNPDAALSLASALDSLMTFRPIDTNNLDRPLVLAGIPGAGKTITAAKLAAQAKLAGQSVFVATTDTKRAGGVEQLEAFTRILDIPLDVAEDADALRALRDRATDADVAIIDTPGINPFDDDATDQVHQFADAVGGEIILVLPAGGDAMESADTAAAFADIGATRTIITRLDMTRRLGGIVAASVSSRLAVANVSVNPNVADGLSQLNPVSLARLIIPDDEQAPQTKAVQ